MKKYFLNLFALFMIIILFGCSAGQKPLSLEKFSQVSVGDTVKQLETKLGKPDRIQKNNPGEEVYVYLERILSENRLIMFRQYLFVIRNGKVVSQKIVYENRELDDRNAYDLQTSQNETN